MAKKGNASGLIKFNKRVKAIRNAHPRMTHAAAQQQAKRENKASGRKVGAVKKAAPKKRKKAAHPTRWKESKKTVVSSSVGGTVGGTVAHTRSVLERQLKEQLAWALLARDSADKVRDRKKKAKRVTELKRELRAINGIKKGR